VQSSNYATFVNDNIRVVPSFQTVFRLIPAIKDSINSLEFHGVDTDVGMADDDAIFDLYDVLITLSTGKNLEQLPLYNIESRLCLNHIAILLNPHLKDLSISASCYHAILLGSLEKCLSLEKFSLYLCHVN